MADRPRPHLTVLGLGYLGLTHAVCMADAGFEVKGLDVDASRVDLLQRKISPLHEPGVPELLASGVDSGRLTFTTSYPEVAEFGDVHFVCVGTPQARDGLSYDLSQVYGCVRALAPSLNRPCLVVGKSTVPALAAADVDRLVASIAPVGAGAEVCWNPEFLREGNAVYDTLRPERIVIGVSGPGRAEEVLRDVYAKQILQVGSEFIVTDLVTAALSKQAANSWLALKISYANALAGMCDQLGADVKALEAIVGADSRIGRKGMQPGVGFGGGCLPKDVRALLMEAQQSGAEPVAELMRLVDKINLASRTAMADLTRRVVGGSLEGRKVCVLGAAFKPRSDDIRDSPALAVAKMLQNLGAEVTVHDPRAIENARRAYPELGYATTVEAAATGADVVVLLTDWPEYADLTPAQLDRVVGRRHLIDGRHQLNARVGEWRKAGWGYHAVGIPEPAPAGPGLPGLPDALLAAPGAQAGKGGSGRKRSRRKGPMLGRLLGTDRGAAG